MAARQAARGRKRKADTREASAVRPRKNKGSLERRSTRLRKIFVPFQSPALVAKKNAKRKRGEEKKKKEPKLINEDTKRGKRKAGKTTPVKAAKDVKEKKKAVKGNDRLKPRPSIIVPSEFGEYSKVEYVSWWSLYRHLINAVCRQDLKAVAEILDDERLNSWMAQRCYSHLDRRSAVVEAIASGNRSLYNLVLSRIHEIAQLKRPDMREINLLERRPTGERNFYMLGRATRNIESVRGGREGNNAFINYDALSISSTQVSAELWKRGVSFGTIAELAHRKDNDPHIRIYLAELQYSVAEMVRGGQREIASAVATDYKQNFNKLHLETLKDGGCLPDRILRVSVRKKALENRDMTPAHTAAVNPDTKFLKRFREVDAMINHPDADNWYTMHYAAVCENDGPLRFLLSLEIGIQDVTKRGETPLHVAAQLGRAANVKILLETIEKLEKKAPVEKSKPEAAEMDGGGDMENGEEGEAEEEEEDEEEDEEPPRKRRRGRGRRVEKARPKRRKRATPKKGKNGFISIANSKTKEGITALHLAAMNGKTDAVKVLLACAVVDKEARASPNHKSMTALMMAVGAGHHETATALIEGGCLIEAKDKLRRSPLMIAVMNGQTRIVADLLRRGADVVRKDSSSNTAMHYACAYGWLDCARLIADVDPATVSASNDWQITPLSISYLKGHHGIFKWLLEPPRAALVDINCKDNDGVCLLTSLIRDFGCDYGDDFLSHIDFLIKNGASGAVLDTEGNSPLHMLAALQIVLRVQNGDIGEPRYDNESRLTSADYKACVEKLVNAGASMTQRNAAGKTPFRIALEAGNLFLAEYFYDQVGLAVLEEEYSKEGKEPDCANIAHLLFSLPFTILERSNLWAYASFPERGQWNIAPFFDKIKKEVEEKVILSWLQAPDSEGRTPLLLFALKYCSNSSRTTNGLPEFSRINLALRKLMKEALQMCPAALFVRKHIREEDKAKMSEEEVLSLPSLIKSSIDLSNAYGFGILEDVVLDVAKKSKQLDAFFEFPFFHGGLPTTPLLYTITERKFEEAKLLLDAAKKAGIAAKVHGAQFDTRLDSGTHERVPWGKTSLMVAVENEMHQLLPHFHLSKKQAAQADADGWTVWHYAAAKLNAGTITLFEAVQKLGVPIDNSISTDLTPLHLAVNAELTGSADAFLDPIEWLLEKVDPNVKDMRGRTALFYAFEKRSGGNWKQDPIAVVSLLLGAMSKEAIRAADREGNTALHLAAKGDSNVCAVTLIANGAEVDARNNEGNTPLALALFHKCLTTSMTLIQAHADISGSVYGPEPEKKEEAEDSWRFRGTAVEKPKRFECTIPALVVRNEWHALVYVMLDLLGKTASTVSRLIAAALQNSQHNFALYLIKLLGKRTPAVTAALTEHRPLMHYTESFGACAVQGAALTVLTKLFDLGIEFSAAEVESAISRGCYQLVTEFKKQSPECWMALSPSAPGRSVIREIIERWISHPDEESQLRCLLADFETFDWVSIDDPIDAPKPALPGLSVPLEPREYVKATPLARAVQAQCVSLIRCLLSMEVDVNQGEVPPLLQAITTNRNAVITMLVEGPGLRSVELNKTNGAANSFFGLRTNCAVPSSVTPSFVSKQRVGNRKSFWSFGQGQGSSNTNSNQMDVEDSEPEKDRIHLTHSNKTLDLSVIDSAGRNLCHYLVEPCFYENVALLEAFANIPNSPVKKLLVSKDSTRERMTPIELAERKGQWRMHAAMCKIAELSPGDSGPADFFIPSPSPYDCASDAEKYCAEQENNISTKPKQKNDADVPDPKTGYSKTGRIVFCDETSQLFKVLLNRSDLRGGTYGFHNYYKMELIKRKDSELYVIFTNWGRIGDPKGEYQCTPFGSLAAATKEWRSIWRQKTGNDWLQLAKFEEKPDKYRLVKTEERRNGLCDIEVEPFDLSEENAEDEVMRFFADVANIKMLKKYSKQVNIQGTNVSCPFGRMSRDDIKKATEILSQLDVNISELKVLYSNATAPVHPDKLLHLLDQQRSLSSSFYTALPFGGFEKSALQVIDSDLQVQRTHEMLRQLVDIEAAGRLIAAAAFNRNTIAPIRYISTAVECPMRPLASTDDFSQRVLQWITASETRVNVRGLFDIRPRSCALRFQEHQHCPNTTYLFHGTRAENMLSILQDGLVPTPAQALQTGQSYGKGIYLADAFAKSAHYSQPSGSGCYYMLICKVALGTVCDSGSNLTETSPFDTLVVNGQRFPEPSGNLHFDGALLPCGQLTRGQRGVTMARYDWTEYVVKESSRVMPSHLIVYKR